MKAIKIFITLAILIGGSVFGLYYVSPVLSVQILEPQHTYGDSLSLSMNVKNFSPIQKKFGITNTNSDIILLVDGAAAPSKTDDKNATDFISLAPFENKFYTQSLTLVSSSNDESGAQVVLPTATQLVVSPGQHSIQISWGGYTSQPTTFGVR